jgi:phenylacetate-coenzyme A ligase PaaK-like adenylate-forming protein
LFLTFCILFPINYFLTKDLEQVSEETKKLIFNHLKEYNTISTGGSSGEPTAFPTNKDESNFLYSNIYIGRSWWNIKPLDPTLLYWGHSHLFGSGIKGKINEFKKLAS